MRICSERTDNKAGYRYVPLRDSASSQVRCVPSVKGCTRAGKGSSMASACSIAVWAGTPQSGEQITGGGYDRYDKGH